jgi:hypothetical protein
MIGFIGHNAKNDKVALLTEPAKRSKIIMFGHINGKMAQGFLFKQIQAKDSVGRGKWGLKHYWCWRRSLE